MTLQLLREPLEIRVETVLRRDHELPVRYRDAGGWHQVVSVAGPDRVSGGVWEGAYAREYFRAVTADGMLVWLFRDARRGRGGGGGGGGGWHLHGWWD